MILVDTAVWIDHINASVSELLNRLDSGQVLTHPMVIGEIACGTIRNRAEILSYLWALPMIEEVDHETVLQEIETNRLMGRGIRFIDAHLLAAVIINRDASLWTRDRRLNRIAEEMGLSFTERS